MCRTFAQPITSHQSPVTSHESPVTSHESPVTSHESPVTSHESPVTNHTHRIPMAHFFLAADPLEVLAVYSPKCGSNSIRSWCKAAIEEKTKQPVEDLDAFLIWHGDIDRCRDYWKVFFVRDPLRRLVGFYTLWVVRDETLWCFADDDRKLSLRDKSFRKFLYTLQHVQTRGIEPQHHLVPQVRNTHQIDFDEVVAVEDLSRGLASLNERVSVSAPVLHENPSPQDVTIRERATDRSPGWLRRHGMPVPELFYDGETRELALRICAEDVSYYREATGREVCGVG